MQALREVFFVNFLPREICERLVEKGCKSESHYYWAQENKGDQPHYKYVSWSKRDKLIKPVCDAFIFQDFCGISEQAIINMDKLWPGSRLHFGYPICNFCGLNQDSWDEPFRCIYDIRAKSLDMTWDEWVEFMRKAVL